MSTFEEETLIHKDNGITQHIFPIESDDKLTNQFNNLDNDEDIILQVKEIQNVTVESNDNVSVETNESMQKDNNLQESNSNFFNIVSEININSDIDQIYEFTINELYRKLNQNNDTIFPGKKQKLPAPLITYNVNGSRRTVCSNFELICNEMNRKNRHVADFIKTDLKKENTIGSNGELRIVGRYDTMFGNSLDRYINKFVLCKSCGSIKTNLVENMNFGLDYVVCTNCQEKRSVN